MKRSINRSLRSELTDTFQDDQFPRLRNWPRPVLAVLVRLSEAGFDAYLVGGCVRDRLLSRPVHDYDVATSALPDDVQRLFTATAATGVKHGTVTVLEFGVPIEVTTFRVDLGYGDGRRPDAVVFTSDVIADLARRDFTVNAIAVDSSGQVVDPFHGQDDAVRKLIRAVGRAGDRFSEDALRILRGLRFAAQLGFHIESGTRTAMASASPMLRHVSTERIGQEFERIAGSDWLQVLPELADGPFVSSLPEPWPALQAGFRRLYGLQWQAGDWQHTNTAFVKSVKTLTASAGTGTQVGHADTGLEELRTRLSVALWMTAGELPDAVVRRLCRDTAWTKQRSDAIVAASHIAKDTDPAQWRAAQWRSACFERDPIALLIACTCLDAVTAFEPGRAQTRVDGLLHAAAVQPLWRLRQLAVNGRDLTALGVRGAGVGWLLAHLTKQVLDGRLPNTAAVLRAAAVAFIEHEGQELT